MRQYIRDSEESSRRNTLRQQKEALYYGLNFKRQIIPDDVYTAIIEHMAQAPPDHWKPEGSETAVHNFFSTASVSEALCTVANRPFEDWILEQMQPLHEQWCGFPLKPIAAYGPRRYFYGAYLEKHVDRPERIISSTLCIDYALELPWPLYIEDGKGNPYFVDMLPGDFCFYESATLTHGRPYPMIGEAYVGMYLHYAAKEK